MAKLFMMDFQAEKVKVNMLYKNESVLKELKNSSPTKNLIPKVAETYSDIYFPEAPEDRPYTFSSIVLSSDGKMAFTDSQEGPLIAKHNYLDPNGSLADFYMLNFLRAYADGIIIGAKTLQSEAMATSHVFDNRLAEERVKFLNKPRHPWNIIVSFDATDIPFEHLIFNIDEEEEFKVFIATSPDGKNYIEKNSPLEHIFFGPYVNQEEIDIAEMKKTLNNNKEAIPVFITGQGVAPDSKLLMYILRKLGLQALCIESPSYTWHLMNEKALDEYFIDYSCVFAGGNISPGYNLPFSNTKHPHSQLILLGMHQESFIFTRQRLLYDVSSDVDLSEYKY